MSIKGLEQAIENLNSISKTAVPRASAQAVNRVANRAVSRSVAVVSKDTRVPRKLVKQRARVKRATVNRPRALIRVNPTADPTQEKLKVFYIDAKSSETNEVVEFTLSSPMDLQGQMIPTRQLHSLCTWCIRNKYRTGDGCDYAGTRYFDKNNNPVDDPSLDVCNGTLTACKLRHGYSNELPFGGFPGTSLIRS